MSTPSGKLKAESGLNSLRYHCATSCFRFPDSTLRSGVTLIELLITITIISILSATFLGVSNLAMESAREARTKTTISKIHGLLMEKWNEYATRRVDVNADIDQQTQNNINNPASSVAANQKRRAVGEARADLRLLALRELMAAEMPDSWSDILNKPVGTPLGDIPNSPRILNAFPAIRGTYLRRYIQVTNKIPPNTTENEDIIKANQGAECLYMIVMLTTADGEARSLFSEQDIGDTDDDGAPEFLDGWGRPIHFIRWAPGFAARSDLMSGDADQDHDSLDIFRRDQPEATRPGNHLYGINQTFINELSDMNPAFRLLPLIYSSGPDGETDIDDEPYLGSSPLTSLDPYAIDPDNPLTDVTAIVPNVNNYVFGLPADMNDDGDDNSLDNIHNHLQDNR